DRIDRATSLGAKGKLRFGPNCAVAKRNAKLREVARSGGGKFVIFWLLPGNLRRSGAGQLDAAQVYKLTKLFGQGIEIEIGIGVELLLCAGGFDPQELRVTLQRIERQRSVHTADRDVRVHRLIPTDGF